MKLHRRKQIRLLPNNLNNLDTKYQKRFKPHLNRYKIPEMSTQSHEPHQDKTSKNNTYKIKRSKVKPIEDNDDPEVQVEIFKVIQEKFIEENKKKIVQV